MKLLARVLGLLGLLAIIFVNSYLGITLVLVGALCGIAANNAEKSEMEALRYQGAASTLSKLGSFAPPPDDK